MNLHLGTSKDNWGYYLDQIKNFVGKDMQKCEDYKAFIAIEFDTSWRSEVSAIFTEKKYLDGQYGIMIYKRKNHDDQLFIPVQYIDTIFGL